jgi:Fic family protein
MSSSEAESLGLMEPMLPQDGKSGELNDLAVELVAKSEKLSGQVNPVLQASLGDLVRSMNCYYSNFIEGHNTLPRDIDRALNNKYDTDPKKRNLQMEARAHIEVQRMIDRREWNGDIVSDDFIKWVHKGFCERLPDEMLWIENPNSRERVQVIPGEYRDGEVAVGRHLPISSDAIERFMRRFAEAYNSKRLGKLKSIVAVAASHHRLLWIHPFYDGNGRVTRLFSHAFLQSLGIGNSLWSVSRGLARKKETYKELLMGADLPRRNDLDGRGTLSEESLVDFCKFFLEICIDQIEYMTSLLEPKELLTRMDIYVEEEIRAGRLHKGSMSLLKEALMFGEFDRGKASDITGYQSRQATTVLSQLTTAGLLVSETPRGAVRLGFPIDIVERWFPKLYPQV